MISVTYSDSASHLLGKKVKSSSKEEGSGVLVPGWAPRATTQPEFPAPRNSPCPRAECGTIR